MKQTYVKGRLHYPDPPEAGTILGPNDIGELMVVIGHDGPDTLVGYATTTDMEDARERVEAEGPRSLAELRPTRIKGHRPK